MHNKTSYMMLDSFNMKSQWLENNCFQWWITFWTESIWSAITCLRTFRTEVEHSNNMGDIVRIFITFDRRIPLVIIRSILTTGRRVRYTNPRCVVFLALNPQFTIQQNNTQLRTTSSYTDILFVIVEWFPEYLDLQMYVQKSEFVDLIGSYHIWSQSFVYPTWQLVRNLEVPSVSCPVTL